MDTISTRSGSLANFPGWKSVRLRYTSAGRIAGLPALAGIGLCAWPSCLARHRSVPLVVSQWRIETHQWSQPLISIVDLAAAGGRCDMLVAPSDIRSALAGVLSFAGSMESPCVVVAGEIGGSAENIELAEVLAQQTGAEALALVNPGNQTLEQWILALLRISRMTRLSISRWRRR